VFAGDEDDTPEGTTKSPAGVFVFFNPRPLTNLLLIDELDSLSPILDFKVADLAREHTPQIYAV
jgi:splicing factor 3B subunit 3